MTGRGAAHLIVLTARVIVLIVVVTLVVAVAVIVAPMVVVSVAAKAAHVDAKLAATAAVVIAVKRSPPVEIRNAPQGHYGRGLIRYGLCFNRETRRAVWPKAKSATF